ncbi:Endonuclease V [Nitrosovibrio tenuis]|uniref:Endonuclease V n=2 Tax=Nitrosovibrio tenuis TaxID=1233 RepID=A0A1H7K3H4_9PROT|nr:Endonuclease V [Nitrosovibrio tenuis]
MMPALHPHDWNVTPQEAVAIQERMRHLVETADRLPQIYRVAGVDACFDADSQIVRAAAIVLSFPDLKLMDHAVAQRAVKFPYVSGLFAFRELPAVLDALGRLHKSPDIIICDGHGIAHPRRFGIASHLGVLLGQPTIGVGKTLLVGHHIELPREKGSWVSLDDGNEVIGAVLRTQTGVKPVYVSIGHRIALQTAVRLVLACTTRYRLPETTREAHRLASGKPRLYSLDPPPSNG